MTAPAPSELNILFITADQLRADVLHGRPESVIREHLREVVEPREGTVLGEGQEQRTQRGENTEGQEQHGVAAREDVSDPGLTPVRPAP